MLEESLVQVGEEMGSLRHLNLVAWAEFAGGSHPLSRSSSSSDWSDAEFDENVPSLP